MAKPIVLTGRTELLAAIYNEDNLPTAVIMPYDSYQPFCLHSLRDGDERTVDKLIEYAAENTSTDEEPKFKLYRFFEDYPEQSHTCHGCYWNSKNINSDIVAHQIALTEQFATKTCDECA
jgi:hypothetical protein